MKDYEFHRKSGDIVTIAGKDLADAFASFRRLYADSSPKAIIEKGFKPGSKQAKAAESKE